MAKSKQTYMNNPNLPAVGSEFEYSPSQIKQLQKASKNLLYFAENFFYIISPDEGRQKIKLHLPQKRVLRKMRDNRFFVLLASRQIGKALALDTFIPTPYGGTTMGQLKDGDVIYGNNNTLTTVVKAWDIMYNRPCYKIVFSNNDEIVADENHLWFTQNIIEQNASIKGSKKTTKEIFDTLYHDNNQPNHYIVTNQSNLYIKNIYAVESTPVRCITVDNEDSMFLCGKTSIPTCNTTMMTIYALWVACFNSDQRILIVANKEETAIEILSRVRLAYECLPNWLKPGVKEFAKTSVLLANGTKIGISTTTGTAARGQSVNCVTGDTIVTLKNKKTRVIFDIDMKELARILEETNGIMSTVIEPQEAAMADLYNHTTFINTKFQVRTDEGFKDFAGIIVGVNKDKIHITLSNDKQLICTPKHKIITDNRFNYKYASDLVKGDTLFNNITVESVSAYKDDKPVYELLHVADNHTYYTNGILSKNCLILDELAFIESHLVDEFWRSVYPIISASKKSKIFVASTANGVGNLFYRLYNGAESEESNWACDKILWNEIPGRDEKWKQDTIASIGSVEAWNQEFNCMFIDAGEGSLTEDLHQRLMQEVQEPKFVFDEGKYLLWEEPNNNGIYIASVDTAEGVGSDYSVIQIFDYQDLTNIKQVATYASNSISPYNFTEKVHEILQHWGRPLVCIERNNCGAQIVDNLFHQHNYENIVSWGASTAGRSKNQLGIIAHTNTKQKGVTNMRYWVNEIESVKIRDINLVKELRNFTRYSNGTWAAKKGAGNHDDRVMSLIWNLIILEDEIVKTYFDVLQYDKNRKPLQIKQFDFGIKYFMNPTSIYSNQRTDEYDNVSPIIIGNAMNQSSDLDQLMEIGFKPL